MADETGKNPATRFRLTQPDLNVPFQINQAGIGIINLFTNDLFDFINSNLTSLLGDNWMSNTVNSDGHESYPNFFDPSVLLKDLGRKINPTLRLPINSTIPSDHHFSFYNLLDEIHGERHLWIHQEIEPNKKNFLALVDLVIRVAAFLALPIGVECQELIEKSGQKSPIEQPKTLDDLSTQSELMNAINLLTKDEPTAIGSPLNGPYLDFSYTLHLNGGIRDRDSSLLLSEVNPNAESIGALLIARKPKGGRIRLTDRGVLAAYFDDHWGFLAQIEPENWFEGHVILVEEANTYPNTLSQ